MKVNSEAEMLALGRQFAENLSFPAVFELIGDVGAGKTTFTRGLAAGLGVQGAVTSPSFTISKRYAFPDGILIHYDFYRLDDPGIMREELSEALALPNSVVIVEWGGDVADLLPAHKTRVEFALTPDGGRELKITSPAQPASTSLAPSAFSSSAPESPVTLGSSACELYLDTSTDLCQLRINQHSYAQNFGHDMAEQIFTFIHAKLAENGFDWPDISRITYFSGPGSFTGLRIGAAVVNALAAQLNIPLFDHHGRQHPVIIPEYGRPANISAPKK